MKKVLEIEIPKFLTHIHTSKYKTLKIGFQKMYAGMHPMVRKKVMKDLHDYLEDAIPSKTFKQSFAAKPFKMHIEAHAPINWPQVKWYRDKGLKWTPPKKGYVPNWDIDNLMVIWIKLLNDHMVDHGLMPDDNVAYLRGCSYEYIECATLDDRKLVYQLFQ